MISTFIELCFMYLIFILCTARMREQHESDSEDGEDVEDVARQYFIYSILVHVASLVLCVISRAVYFYTRDL